MYNLKKKINKYIILKKHLKKEILYKWKGGQFFFYSFDSLMFKESPAFVHTQEEINHLYVNYIKNLVKFGRAVFNLIYFQIVLSLPESLITCIIPKTNKCWNFSWKISSGPKNIYSRTVLGYVIKNKTVEKKQSTKGCKGWYDKI